MSRLYRLLLARRRVSLAVLSVAGAALLGSVPGAHAQMTALPAPTLIEYDEDDEIEVPAFLWGFSIHTLVGSTSMAELNDAIRVANTRIETRQDGIRYLEASSAPSFGIGLRAVLKSRLTLTAEYETLIRSTEVGGESSRAVLELPSTNAGMNVAWNFLSGPYKRFGFGVGLSYWESNATHVYYADAEEIGRINLEGDTLGQNYFMQFELPLTESLYAHAHMGWRIAKMDDIDIVGLEELDIRETDTSFVLEPIAERELISEATEDNPAVWGPPTLLGGTTTLDYSGFYGRVGVTFYWNPPDRF